MAQLAQDHEASQMRNALSGVAYPADWFIEDDLTVPKSKEHDDHEDNLKSKLRAYVRRTERNWLVGCELAFRWDEEEPRVGVDPDVYVAEMPPAEPDGDIRRVRTWEKGNFAPLLAIEIVSKSRPGKDYKDSPKKHDLLGTLELWVFDPGLLGYTAAQPPVLLQIFRRKPNRRLVQVYAGEGPYRSDALNAWVMVIDGELVIANDQEGNDPWPTLEEAEAQRADAEAQRADAEAQRADTEAQRAKDALTRVAELEALLAKRA